MKISRLVLLCLAITVADGCKKPVIQPIAPKQPAANDTWCQYNITAQTPGCGANRVGQTICIFCNPPLPGKPAFAPNQLCPNPPGRLVVSPSEGCEFTLLPLAPGQQQCENCTARPGGTYQVSSRPGVP